MERFWLKNYPEGVPSDIDPTRYPSLVALLEEAFTQFGARVAFDSLGATLTYREVEQASRALGAWFQAQGLARGARIAIMLPNGLQYPVVMAAVLRAGYVVVNINPLYTPRELEAQLRDSGAEAIVVLESFAATLQAVLGRTMLKHVLVARLGDLMGTGKGFVVNAVLRYVQKRVPAYDLPTAVPLKAALRQGRQCLWRPPVVGPDDLAFLQYTGGTTGVAKGACLSHRNLVANVLQARAWIEPALRDPGKGSAPEQWVWVCALPLYHIFALTACCLLGMHVGGLNVLIANPRDLRGLVKAVRPYQINLFPAVNTLFNALVRDASFRALDFSGLRIALGGGAAIHPSVAQAWFDVTGCPLCEAYGLSETSPAVSANPSNLTAFNGSIGLPFPSTEIQILDEQHQPVPHGQTGEIAVRGPQVMQGYWQAPAETAQVLLPNGFLLTGDVGIMDEAGYTRIVDRKKDIVLVSGFNVFPNEVEAVLAAHPGVMECAAIGVPDAHSGEVVKVFVVRKDPELSEESVRAWCRERLVGYKRPKYIEFKSELPKSPIGKIVRRLLREASSPGVVGASTRP